MKYYSSLVLNIPDIENDHKARSEKLSNKLCDEWSSLKYEIDLIIEKTLNIEFGDQKSCFCCLNHLTAKHIYGDWNGNPWLCHNDLKPQPPPNFDKIKQKNENDFPIEKGRAK